MCGATSNFLGYHGFPATICTSVNEEVVHGIPGDRVLQDGDILSIDGGAILDGHRPRGSHASRVVHVGPLYAGQSGQLGGGQAPLAAESTR